jgi:lipopolysaccharide/colanic/teichoic acid biosynthesis glycosyltransferase
MKTYASNPGWVIAVRSDNKNPTIKGPGHCAAGCSKVRAIDPAIFTKNPATLFEQAAKRAFDIIAATIGLMIFSPMFLLVPIAIKIDSRGPVFRLQMRHGYHNEKIAALKFRSTMVTQAGKNTPFVTRFGGVLRRTGIDALPQLINILRGEMSIVGPAPFVAAPNKIFAEEISSIQRHRVKPGIIGWAQVNGCWGESNTREVTRRRIEYDSYYIDNWSFLFDIKIILMNLFSKDSYSNR